MKGRDILTRGELFKKVQQQEMFQDSKIFVDSFPKKDPDEIRKNIPGNDLKHFVQINFDLPENKEVKTPENLDIKMYIHESWKNLQISDTEDQGTYLGLENPYIIPEGGRIRELYYWDSYLTMLGLQQSGNIEIIEGIFENFASQIDRHGFIPNGNRSYYLDRSQPPFFGEMLKILE